MYYKKKNHTSLSQVSVIYSLSFPLNIFSFPPVVDKVTFHCSSAMFLFVAVICFDICGLELSKICFYYVWIFYQKALAALFLQDICFCPADSLPCVVF